MVRDKTFFSSVRRPHRVLGPPIFLLNGYLQPRSETDHSHPSSVEV